MGCGASACCFHAAGAGAQGGSTEAGRALEGGGHQAGQICSGQQCCERTLVSSSAPLISEHAPVHRSIREFAVWWYGQVCQHSTGETLMKDAVVAGGWVDAAAEAEEGAAGGQPEAAAAAAGCTGGGAAATGGGGRSAAPPGHG